MKKDVFLLDFDGTIALNDSTDCIASTLIPEKYKQYMQGFYAGEFTVKDFIYDLITSLEITEQTFKETIKEHINVDKTFVDFVNSGFEFYIVSSGTVLNITSALETIDVTLNENQIFSNDIHFDGTKITLSNKHYDPENGMDKAKIVSIFKDKGYRVIFVGDGHSDFKASKCADMVFAREGTILVEKCKEMNLNCTEFADFNDLLSKYKL